MNDTDRPRFATLLVALAEVFDKPLSDAVLGVYFDALKDLPIEVVQNAVAVSIGSLKFMPKPAEIRECAGAGAPALADRALLAWTAAWEAVHRVGAWRSVQFDDPVMIATIDGMGGWTAFCRPQVAEQWHRKEFLDLYRALDAQRGALPVMPLLSSSDMSNIRGGYDDYVTQPKQIGARAPLPALPAPEGHAPAQNHHPLTGQEISEILAKIQRGEAP